MDEETIKKYSYATLISTADSDGLACAWRCIRQKALRVSTVLRAVRPEPSEAPLQVPSRPQAVNVQLEVNLQALQGKVHYGEPMPGAIFWSK